MTNPLFPIEDVSLSNTEDIGQRFIVAELPSTSLLMFEDKGKRWYIVDRNTDDAVIGSAFPNGKGKRFWRGNEQSAHLHCAQLNSKRIINF